MDVGHDGDKITFGWRRLVHISGNRLIHNSFSGLGRKIVTNEIILYVKFISLTPSKWLTVQKSYPFRKDPKWGLK